MAPSPAGARARGGGRGPGLEPGESRGEWGLGLEGVRRPHPAARGREGGSQGIVSALLDVEARVDLDAVSGKKGAPSG